MNKKNGGLLISLDFEKFWGVCSSKTLDNYGENILNVKYVIPKLIALFEKYEIHVTWAYVGFLGFENMDVLKKNIPSSEPKYINTNNSTYTYIARYQSNQHQYYFLDNNELGQIYNSKNAELCSHTFSHLFCLEKGVGKNDFENDLLAFNKIQAHNNYRKAKSIIFPRNEINSDFLYLLEKYGYSSYRGIEESFGYRGNSLIHKAFRLVDNFINLSGSNSFRQESCKTNNSLLNIRGSKFLRPVTKNKILNVLALIRLKKAMRVAGSKNEFFHIWFHPHNFGSNIESNFFNLEEILKYFKELQSKYKFETLTMSEFSEKF